MLLELDLLSAGFNFFLVVEVEAGGGGQAGMQHLEAACNNNKRHTSTSYCCCCCRRRKIVRVVESWWGGSTSRKWKWIGRRDFVVDLSWWLLSSSFSTTSLHNERTNQQRKFWKIFPVLVPACVEGAVGIRSRNRDYCSEKRLVLHSCVNTYTVVHCLRLVSKVRLVSQEV